MPRRRDESFITVLSHFFVAMPWWIGPIIAALAFVLFGFVVPAVVPSGLPSGGGSPGNQIMNKTIIQVIGVASTRFAPFAAGIVSIVWLISLVLKKRRRELLESQADLESIRSLSWRNFELLIGEYYRRKDYQVLESGGPSPDGGVDLALRKDGRITLVQCKHWKEFKVGVKPARELLGVMTSLKAQGSILVTSGEFTNDAREFAQSNGIELINGDKLVPMIQSVQTTNRQPPVGSSGMAAAASASSPVPAPTDSGPVVPQGASQPPSCPKCGAPMVIRTARTGSNPGSQFYGCTSYPKCKGIRDLSDV